MLWERLPLIGEPLRAARMEATKVTVAAVTRITELVLDQIDLTALVRERVDIDAIVADVDIDAIIARVDLVGLADQIIDGVDLPEIIRESTGSMASETVQGVRMQGIGADQAVGRAVDRLLLRHARTNGAPKS